MPDTLALGTETAPWQIKGLSVALREAITKAARDQNCTVAEYLHGHFVKHGLGDVPVEPRPNLPDQTIIGVSDGIGDLGRLVEMSARFAEHRDKLPKALAGALSRRLREAVTAAPGFKALPAPHRINRLERRERV